MRLFLLILIITGQFFNVTCNAQVGPVVIVPFILNYDHIIIQIRLNDSEPLNFLFDSGAGGTLISEQVADSLGFKSTVNRKNVGVSGEHKVGLIKGIKLSVGDKKLGSINLLSTDTPLEEMDDGRKVHGVIGYPILSRYVVEIDYTGSQLKLFNRNSFSYKGEGKLLPIEIEFNLPIARAIIVMYNGKSFEGDFLIDTGARSDLIISSPSVIKYDMAKNIGNHYTIRTNIGSSQRRTKIRYGRLQSIQFAEYKFENIPVALSSDNKGVLSNSNINGIIGNRLLQRFNVIFDYQKGFIYLEPSVLIGNDYDINSSGFNVNFKSGKPYVKNLIDRSPADESGIRNGDEIISINGNLVESMTADEIRSSFFKGGEEIEIVIKRNKKYKYTEFILKTLI